MNESNKKNSERRRSAYEEGGKRCYEELRGLAQRFQRRQESEGRTFYRANLLRRLRFQIQDIHAVAEASKSDRAQGHAQSSEIVAKGILER